MKTKDTNKTKPATKATKAPAKAKAKATKTASPLLTGEMLRKGVAKATSKVKAKAIEVVDVTADVMGAIEAKATKAKAPRKAKAKDVAAVLTHAITTGTIDEGVVLPVKVDVTTDVTPLDSKAVDAVYAYAENAGIDIGDVVRIAKTCGEYAGLVEAAGTEITDEIVAAAGRKAREFDARVVHPHTPKTGLKRVSAERGVAKATGPKGAKARILVLGHGASSVVRALRTTCAMTFKQIRAVMNALGGESVSDNTIRTYMSNNGLKRGECAPLTPSQFEQAKAVALVG